MNEKAIKAKKSLKDNYDDCIVEPECDSLYISLFSTGNSETITKVKGSYVKSRKKKLMLDSFYKPTAGLFCLVTALAKKRTRHFFHDMMFIVNVMTIELGVSINELCSFRGWQMSRDNKKRVYKVEYRRKSHTLDSLKKSNPRAAESLSKISSILDKLYLIIKGETKKEEMPSKHRISFHERNSIIATINTLIQHFQLAWHIIPWIFEGCHKKYCISKDYNQRILFITSVFEECKKRKDFLLGLQHLLQVFQSKNDVNTMLPTLVNDWVTVPSQLLKKAKKEKVNKVDDDYDQKLRNNIEHFAKKQNYFHPTCKKEMQHLILRIAVMAELSTFQSKYDKYKTTSKSYKNRIADILNGKKDECSKINKRKKRKVNTTNNNDDNNNNNSNNLNNNIDDNTIITEVSPSLDKCFSLENDKEASIDIINNNNTTIANRDTIINNDGNNDNNNNIADINNNITNNKDVTDFLSESRWNNIKFASLDNMKEYTTDLIIFMDDFILRDKHSNCGFYLAYDLLFHDHLFYIDKKEKNIYNNVSAHFSIENHCLKSISHPKLKVVRQGCNLFDKIFAKARYSIVEIAKLILNHGKKDTTRDVSKSINELNTYGVRVDFGNGGSAPERGMNHFKPKTLCGLSIFDNIEKEEALLIRASIGSIIDCMHECMCAVEGKSLKEMSMSLNKKRATEFLEHLKAYLFGKNFFYEWLTIILENITHLMGGKVHTDRNNCPLFGYNKTCCHYIVFRDGIGELWIMKFIANWRSVCSNYVTKSLHKINDIEVRLNLYLSDIDDGYDRYILNYNGTYMSTSNLCWENVDEYWLDDHSPYTKENIGGDIFQEVVILPSNIYRSMWISGACDSLRNISSHVTEKGMIQLIIISSLQNTFCREVEIIKTLLSRAKNEKMKDLSSYPIFKYGEIAIELFDDFVGGPHNRYSPISFKFQEMFMKEEDREYIPDLLFVDEVVDVTINLLDWVNYIIDKYSNRTDKIPINAISKKLEYTNKTFQECCKKHNKKSIELGTFRLQLLIQLSYFAGVRIKKSILIRDLFYPCEGHASYNHLKKNNIPEYQFDEVMEELSKKLGFKKYYRDVIESLLCESMSGRRLTKYDAFIKGQSLLSLADDGSILIKYYGSKVWKPVLPNNYDD